MGRGGGKHSSLARPAALHDVWGWLPAALILGAGLWIYRYSGAGFSVAQLGGLPELIPGHREQRLITSGIRARVRHPIYLGHLCEMLAWSVGSGLAVCYALTLFAVITGAMMIRLEDKELEGRFGGIPRVSAEGASRHAQSKFIQERSIAGLPVRLAGNTGKEAWQECNICY